MSGRFTQPDLDLSKARLSRRYAWYELGLAREEDEVLHGKYDFLNVRAESEPLERAA